MKIDEPFNYEAWLNFKNVRRNLRINRDKLSEPQLTECNRIIEYTKHLILNEYDRRTCFNGIRKTDIGYEIYRECTKNSSQNCDSLWTVYIDLFKSRTNVTYNRLCEHTNSNEEISKKTKLIFV